MDKWISSGSSCIIFHSDRIVSLIGTCPSLWYIQWHVVSRFKILPYPKKNYFRTKNLMCVTKKRSNSFENNDVFTIYALEKTTILFSEFALFLLMESMFVYSATPSFESSRASTQSNECCCRNYTSTRGLTRMVPVTCSGHFFVNSSCDRITVDCSSSQRSICRRSLLLTISRGIYFRTPPPKNPVQLSHILRECVFSNNWGMTHSLYA